MMELKEKVELIDRFLQNIGNQLNNIPFVLDGSALPKQENKTKYKIIENELIRLGLVNIMTSPNTNATLGGWGRFRISPKGLELLSSNQSSMSLFQKEAKIDRLFKVLRIIENAQPNGVSIYKIASELNEELYPVQKIIRVLEQSEIINSIDTRTKDEPFDEMISLTPKGGYVVKDKNRLVEEITDDSNIQPIVFEQISNSIINKGDNVNFSNVASGNENHIQHTPPNKNSNAPTKRIQIWQVILAFIGISIALAMFLKSIGVF